MSSLLQLTISHPEPARDCYRLIPVFLPYAGCPTRCIYCDQQVQSGRQADSLTTLADELEIRLAREAGPYAVGFYGGTFTGMPRQWQKRFLEIAAREKALGKVVHVRASTRPDTLARNWLEHLRDSGLDMLELGIQSFDTEVLAGSRRAYDGMQARSACRMVQDVGLELGIQLLPGLPGHDARRWRADVLETITCSPAAVRVYPCVVMRRTELAEMYAQGCFQPWTLTDTVTELSWSALQFWTQGIRIIRMGIPGEAQPAILAGPWHPAFGTMVRAAALLRLLKEHLRPWAGSRIRQILLPRKLSGEFWGVGRAQAADLELLGITRANTIFSDRTNILVELEK